MDFVKTWLGRIIFATAGIILIAVYASGHDPKQAAGIVTGVCAVVFAIYATIRGLAGGVEVKGGGKGTQLIGLISLSAWYDFVVLGVLVLASIIAWVV